MDFKLIKDHVFFIYFRPINDGKLQLPILECLILIFNICKNFLIDYLGCL